MDKTHLEGKPIIFMGWGANGKTSAIRNLKGRPFTQDSTTTFGAQAVEHDLDGEQVVMMDFPGQDPAYRLAYHIIGDIKQAVFVVVMNKDKFCSSKLDHDNDYKREQAGRLVREAAQPYLAARNKEMSTIMAFSYRDSNDVEQIIDEGSHEKMDLDQVVQVENRVENGTEELREAIRECLVDVEPIKISLVELYASQIADFIDNENKQFKKSSMGFYEPEEFEEFWEYLVERLKNIEGIVVPNEMYPEIIKLLREKGVINDRDGKIYIPIGAEGIEQTEYFELLQGMSLNIKLRTDSAENLMLGLKLACADRIIKEGTDSFRLFLKLDSGEILGIKCSRDHDYLQFHSNADQKEVEDFIVQVAPTLKEWTFKEIEPCIGCECKLCSMLGDYQKHYFRISEIDRFKEEKRITCFSSVKDVENPQELADRFLRIKEALLKKT